MLKRFISSIEKHTLWYETILRQIAKKRFM